MRDDKMETTPTATSSAQSASPTTSKTSLWLRILFLFLCSALMFGGNYAYVDPSSLNHALQSVFGVTDAVFLTQLNLLYSAYSLPNVVAPLITGYILSSSASVRTTTRVATWTNGLVVVGQVIFVTGVWGKYMPVAVIGRAVAGLGAESLLIVQSHYLAEWFTGASLVTAFGVASALGRLAYVINYNLTPWVLTLGQEWGHRHSVFRWLHEWTGFHFVSSFASTSMAPDVCKAGTFIDGRCDLLLKGSVEANDLSSVSSALFVASVSTASSHDLEHDPILAGVMLALTVSIFACVLSFIVGQVTLYLDHRYRTPSPATPEDVEEKRVDAPWTLKRATQMALAPLRSFQHITVPCLITILLYLAYSSVSNSLMTVFTTCLLNADTTRTGGVKMNPAMAGFISSLPDVTSMFVSPFVGLIVGVWTHPTVVVGVCGIVAAIAGGAEGQVTRRLLGPIAMLKSNNNHSYLWSMLMSATFIKMFQNGSGIGSGGSGDGAGNTISPWLWPDAAVLAVGYGAASAVFSNLSWSVMAKTTAEKYQSEIFGLVGALLNVFSCLIPVVMEWVGASEILRHHVEGVLGTLCILGCLGSCLLWHFLMPAKQYEIPKESE